MRMFALYLAQMRLHGRVRIFVPRELRDDLA